MSLLVFSRIDIFCNDEGDTAQLHRRIYCVNRGSRMLGGMIELVNQFLNVTRSHNRGTMQRA